MQPTLEMPQTARMLQRDLDTLSKRSVRVAQQREDTERMLRTLHGATETRFGIDLPDDAHLLDVLAVIEVEPTWMIPGERRWTDARRWRWMWQGRTRHGTATVRFNQGTETTVTTFLARTLGLIPQTNRHSLYPPHGTDPLDVNPYMRLYKGRLLIERVDAAR